MLYTTPSRLITAGTYRDATDNVHATTSLAGEAKQTVTVTTSAGVASLLFTYTASIGTHLMSLRIVQAGASSVVADETDGAQALPILTDEGQFVSVWG